MSTNFSTVDQLNIQSYPITDFSVLEGFADSVKLKYKPVQVNDANKVDTQ